MDFLPIFERLGMPLAFAVYFLLETRRVMRNVDKLQEEQLKYAREDAEMYRHLVMKVVAVVERTNTIIEAVKPLLEETAQREDTRILHAFEPSEILTPPVHNRTLTDEEAERHHSAIERLRERNQRGQNHG